MRRIVHLTTVHTRRDVRIFEKQACSLAAAGFDVHLVVGDGLGKELVHGVQVHDIGAAPATRAGRMWRQPWRALRRVRALRPDIVHFHDPELLPVGWLLRRAGIVVVYDSHEDVPRDILSKAWISPWLRRAVAWLFEQIEDRIAASLSAVVAATPHIAARFARLNPRSLAINNYPANHELASASAAPRAPRTACYVGGIGRIRGSVEMVRALEHLPCRLVMAGGFEDAACEAEMRALPGWARVDYRGVVSRAEVRAIMAEAQIGLLLFHPEPNHVDAQPNKMFEYMSAELPVVASDFPLWRRVLVNEGVGVCVDPRDPAAIAAVMARLFDDPEAARAMGARGRAAVLARYRWDREFDKLKRLYAELAACGAPALPAE